MESTDISKYIRSWQSRLTGLPDESFSGKSLQAKLDLIAQWHASKVIAEQMVVLTIAQAMLEDGVTAKDLMRYFTSTEVKETGLGRFNIVSGLSRWPKRVKQAFLPILRVLGYKPYLPYDTAKGIAFVCGRPGAAEAGLLPGNVADTFYQKFMTPHIQKISLRTLKAFLESQPEAAAHLIQAMSEVRPQGTKMIADIDEVAERVEALEAVDEPDVP